jgi:hypothetical protein
VYGKTVDNIRAVCLVVLAAAEFIVAETELWDRQTKGKTVKIIIGQVGGGVDLVTPHCQHLGKHLTEPG